MMGHLKIITVKILPPIGKQVIATLYPGIS